MVPLVEITKSASATAQVARHGNEPSVLGLREIKVTLPLLTLLLFLRSKPLSNERMLKY